MQGDAIVVEAHHRRAARGVCERILSDVQEPGCRYVVSVAGESGSGKSETAQALAEELAKHDVPAAILQQDDYFALPPRSNDRARREDIGRVGSREVHLESMDENLRAFRNGATTLVKPLVVYERDEITEETLDVAAVRVLVAEGTYTSLLANADARVFIERTYLQTRAHREKRARHASELDPFIDEVLKIEHRIISSHMAHADFLIAPDYSVSAT